MSSIRAIEAVSPRLTVPAVITLKSKVVLEHPGAARGVVLTFIPQVESDPVQSNIDQLFYFRNGDQFSVLSYPMLQRLFAATQTPDLQPVFRAALVSRSDDGSWRIPIALGNNSSAVAQNVTVSVAISNPSSCEQIRATGGLLDESELNPEQTIFMMNMDSVIHRGMNRVAGSLHVKMKGRKRKLCFEIQLFADRMRAKQWDYSVLLTQGAFEPSLDDSRFLY